MGDTHSWEPLSRMLHNEAGWCDLVNLLHHRDPAVLSEAVRAPCSSYAVREFTFPGAELPARGEDGKGRSYGRIDLALFALGDDRTAPCALIELKIDKGVHASVGWPNQLDGYDAGAEVLGVPADRRVLVHAGVVELPNVPDSWRQVRLLDLLRSWQESADPVAASLATDAADFLTWIYDRLDGTTGAAVDSGKVRLIDRIWVRRCYAALRAALQGSGIVLNDQLDTGRGGSVNLSAWVVADDGTYVGVECQRTRTLSGDRGPFSLTLLAGPLDTTGWDADCIEEECVKAADRWRKILDPATLLAHHPWFAESVTPVGDGGFKTSPERGHRYYGYRTTGLGSRLEVAESVTYVRLERLLQELARYLLTVVPAAGS